MVLHCYSNMQAIVNVSLVVYSSAWFFSVQFQPIYASLAEYDTTARTTNLKSVVCCCITLDSTVCVCVCVCVCVTKSDKIITYIIHAFKSGNRPNDSTNHRAASAKLRKWLNFHLLYHTDDSSTVFQFQLFPLPSSPSLASRWWSPLACRPSPPVC